MKKAVSELKLSVSGIRGVWPKPLTSGIAKSAANAFAKFSGSRQILVGTDTRPSGPALKRAVMQGLNMAGADAVDLGIVPTPTICINAKKLSAPGIMITASHNPLKPDHWNGIKLIGANGLFLNEVEIGSFLQTWQNIKETKLVEAGHSGGIQKFTDPFDAHLSLVRRSVDVNLIRKAGFTVALDCVNGAGSIIIKVLLEELGCKVIPINTDPKQVMKTGDFPHKPEPLARNLAALRKLTRKSKADVGFAVDPDADRLAIVSEGGMPIGEEYTLALAVAHILSKSKTRNPVVVTNLSTTSAIDEIAAKHNASVVRTKIGEINVVEQMKGKGAIIGGEGNGGVIFPEVCYNRDSLTAIALTLEYMAATKKKISRLFAELPRHHMIKAKSKGLPSREIAKTAMIKTREFYANDEIITLDGVKVLFKDKSWLHVRASNTEPVVRIIAESKKLGGAKRLINGFLKKLASEKIRIRLDAQE